MKKLLKLYTLFGLIIKLERTGYPLSQKNKIPPMESLIKSTILFPVQLYLVQIIFSLCLTCPPNFSSECPTVFVLLPFDDKHTWIRCEYLSITLTHSLLGIVLVSVVMVLFHSGMVWECFERHYFLDIPTELRFGENKIHSGSHFYWWDNQQSLFVPNMFEFWGGLWVLLFDDSRDCIS